MNVVVQIGSCGIIEFDKLEFNVRKEKGSTNEVSIYFFWRDTDKIISAKHDRHEVAGFWRGMKKINRI